MPSGGSEELDCFEDLTDEKDRGVLKKILRKGTSDLSPFTGDKVTVHYVGTYYGGDQDGEQFDSSRERGEFFEFTIGNGEVIKAWDIGVATMKIGELCELIASPEYGYKDGKSRKFEIELFDTRGMDVSADKTGTVLKSVLEKGRDFLNPTVGLEAEISYRLFNDPEGGDFRDVSYAVGDPAVNEIPECIDLAVRHMNTAERALVRLVDPSTKTAKSAGDVTRERDTLYELRLRSFEKVKHLSSLPTFSEQMSYAESLKLKANDYLKASKYDVAISLYQRLDSDLQYVVANGVSDQKTLNDVINAIRLNLALVYLKLGDAQNCSDKCKKVLESNASNEKALFRLGQACLLRKDHEDAAVYFRRIVANNPSNSAAVNHLRMCESAIRSAEEKERKIFRSIFERSKETGLSGVVEQQSEVVNGDEKLAT
ncbi:unnamed protein product [Dicrocoelium dendriticum]|nr:unnamed protein product [Dicrocoelium dendriticum]